MNVVTSCIATQPRRPRRSAKNIKNVLVGKDAILVGIQNSSFQDIIYQAGVHPKKKASELSNVQIRDLYEAIVRLMKYRKQLGGKDQFTDLYGNRGRYTPAMGPNIKDKKCPNCSTAIEKIAHGGGHVYMCPSCQQL